MANRVTDVPAITEKIEARAALAATGAQSSPAERDALRAQAAGDDVLLLLLERLRAALAGGSARRGHHGGGDGERLADSRPVDDVHRGRVRVLRREEALRRSRAGSDGPRCSSCSSRSWPTGSRMRAPQTIFELADPVRASPATRRCRRCWWRRYSGVAARSGARSRSPSGRRRRSRPSRSFRTSCRRPRPALRSSSGGSADSKP